MKIKSTIVISTLLLLIGCSISPNSEGPTEESNPNEGNSDSH